MADNKLETLAANL